MVISNSAHGASQDANNTGDLIIGPAAAGAAQRGYIGAGATATNDGRGALQLLDLAPGQNALTTADADASILIGAGIASNRNSITVGDGQVSHGDGSITAGGGFFGSGSGLTGITPAQIGALSNTPEAIAAAGGVTNNASGVSFSSTLTTTNLVVTGVQTNKDRVVVEASLTATGLQGMQVPLLLSRYAATEIAGVWGGVAQYGDQPYYTPLILAPSSAAAAQGLQYQITAPCFGTQLVVSSTWLITKQGTVLDPYHRAVTHAHGGSRVLVNSSVVSVTNSDGNDLVYTHTTTVNVAAVIGTYSAWLMCNTQAANTNNCYLLEAWYKWQTP
jgi:hypothetical protein